MPCRSERAPAGTWMESPYARPKVRAAVRKIFHGAPAAEFNLRAEREDDLTHRIDPWRLSPSR